MSLLILTKSLPVTTLLKAHTYKSKYWWIESRSTQKELKSITLSQTMVSGALHRMDTPKQLDTPTSIVQKNSPPMYNIYHRPLLQFN